MLFLVIVRQDLFTLDDAKLVIMHERVKNLRVKVCQKFLMRFTRNNISTALHTQFCTKGILAPQKPTCDPKISSLCHKLHT